MPPPIFSSLSDSLIKHDTSLKFVRFWYWGYAGLLKLMGFNLLGRGNMYHACMWMEVRRQLGTPIFLFHHMGLDSELRSASDNDIYVEVRGQLWGITFLIPPHGPSVLNLDLQVSSSLAEPSPWLFWGMVHLEGSHIMQGSVCPSTHFSVSSSWVLGFW